MSEIIAFYLPQYHPTKSNNEWWGEGFTEWTNVAKAKPLFRGHYQPKVPADLGFYDLRMPEVREKQAALAKQAGVTGFCYYHYWFGNGHEELDLPFKEVVNSGRPEIPFCLCWANESWFKKFWNEDGAVTEKKDLAIQQYPGLQDNINHFNSLLPAFKDNRYMRKDGKLIFMIYKPLEFENVSDFITLWNELAKAQGLNGFHFVAYSLNAEREYEQLMDLGFDSVCSSRIGYGNQSKFMRYVRKFLSVVFNLPRIFFYKNMYPQFIGKIEQEKENVYPTLIPNWDHTPRSTKYGYLYQGSTPSLFYEHVKDVLTKIRHKEPSNRICFLKSWNEWGEGNYMEPDLRYGHGYIEALKKALKEYEE